MINVSRPAPWSRHSLNGAKTSMWDSPIALAAYLMKRSVIHDDAGCYIVTAIKPRPNGYVAVKMPNIDKTRADVYLHRASYLFFVGDIEPGYEIDHVQNLGCVSRACWRPDHLEPVTHRENMRRLVEHRAYLRTLRADKAR